MPIAFLCTLFYFAFTLPFFLVIHLFIRLWFTANYLTLFYLSLHVYDLFPFIFFLSIGLEHLHYGFCVYF